jgi:LacI family transcriptional regulator
MKTGKTDTILVKNKQGARQAVEHLLWHGHKKIVAMGVNPHLYTIQQRVAGYREAMKNAGLDSDVLMIDAENPETTELLRKLMTGPSKPTAVFTLNGLTSIHLLKAIEELEIQVPKELAIVGFDDLQLAEVLDPPLTVMRQPAVAIGESVAQLILERITGERKDIQRLMLPVELVIRRSCGCVPTKS